MGETNTADLTLNLFDTCCERCLPADEEGRPESFCPQLRSLLSRGQNPCRPVAGRTSTVLQRYDNNKESLWIQQYAKYLLDLMRHTHCMIDDVETFFLHIWWFSPVSHQRTSGGWLCNNNKLEAYWAFVTLHQTAAQLSAVTLFYCDFSDF